MSISAPSPSDILCGKDKTYGKHPGNQAYRRMIEDRATSYAIENSKQIKMNVTKEIVATLQNAGARFLRKTHSCKWEEISNQQARDKTSHALRFCAKYHTKKRGSIVSKPPARLTRTRSQQHRRTVSTDTVDQHHDSIAIFQRQQAILNQSLNKVSEPTPDGVASSASMYDILQEPLNDSISGVEWDGYFIQSS